MGAKQSWGERDVIHDNDRVIARHMYRVAVGLVVERAPMPDRETAYDALTRPSPSTIRPLLDAGRGKPWLPSVMDALAEVGVAAAEDVLGGDDV